MSVIYNHKEHEQSIASFEKKGLLVLKVDDENHATPLQCGNQVVQDILSEYIELANQKGGLGLRKEGGFRELVQKDVGRYDLNLDHLIIPRTMESRSLTDAESKMSNIFSYVEERIRCVLPSILTDQYIVNAFGAVISHPNTEAQRWHVDVSHLFQMQAKSADEECLKHLPCHFVTVFCPLYEFSEEIGPTDIALSSKSLTVTLPNRTVEDQYPPDEVVHNILMHPEVEVIKFQAKVGDIGIMDGRTLHRGGFNQSNEVRPLIYLSFCRPWYQEFPRSQNDSRSLFH